MPTNDTRRKDWEIQQYKEAERDDNTMPTTPTPGAVRAAKRIWEQYYPNLETTEQIIDEETDTGELLAALQDFVDAATESSKNESYKANAYGFMMAVLPKARAAIKSATGQG